MKVVLSMSEVEVMVRNCVSAATGVRVIESPSAVRFIHKFADGSGGHDVEEVASIDRVEVYLDSV